MKENSIEESSGLLNVSATDEESQEQQLKIDNNKYLIERNLKTQTYDKSVKVILLGDSMVGKSSIIHRLLKEEFNEDLGPTLSIEYFNYYIKVNDSIIRLQIWDTAGQEKFNSIVKNYCQNTDYGIFVYSIDNLESFFRIKDWLIFSQENNMKTENNQMKHILLGNKKDLGDDARKVSFLDGEKFSKNNNFFIFKEISCKDDDENTKNNFLELFDEIAKNSYNDFIGRRRSTVDSDSFNYVASNTMMELSAKNKMKKSKDKSKKKCC